MGKKITPQEMTRDFCLEEYNINYLMYIENIQAFAKYLIDRGYYKIMNGEEFDRMVHIFLITRYPQAISPRTVSDLVKQTRWQIENRIDDVINTDYIALRDQLLNLNTFEFEPFSEKKYTFYHLNSLSQNLKMNPASRFAHFLQEVIVNKAGEFDPELCNLVQEMFGYCLLNTLEGHAAFFLVGDGNNGKSVLLSVLREMVGKEYCESMSIETITTKQFAPASLIGKKINICVEEESTFVKSDKFKALISGDEISVEYKYGGRFSWKPTVKYVFATNELPTFSGFNTGLLRRIKILPFNKFIDKKKRDTQITGKLIAEMDQVVAWALEGAKRLKANNFNFTEASQSMEKLTEFTGNLSSGVLFICELYEADESGCRWYEELYEEYKAWCDKRGKKKQSYYSFFKDVNKIFKADGEGTRDDLGKRDKYKKISYIKYEQRLPEM